MIDTTEILRFASVNEEAKEILWHLHSYACEKDGDKRFEQEMREWFPDKFEVFESALYGGVLYGSLKFVLSDFRSCASMCKPRFIADLLQDHKARSEKIARERIHLTNIGRIVWETLDLCLEERRPCFLQGWEGRGKSTTARAWFEAHRGQARFVSLPGICTQRDFFSHLAKAYGIPFLNAKAPNEVRFRVSDAVIRSGLALIIDEAHFILPERTQRGRPALIDWIDTQLCNAGVANTLITTPQFGPALGAFENFSTWNARQFRRRYASGWRALDENTTREDLLIVARRALPAAGEKGARLAVNYAESFSRDVVRFNAGDEGIKLQADVSGVFDLVKDAEIRAKKAGRNQASFQDVRDALQFDRMPAENAMAAAFSGPFKIKTPKRSSTAAAELPEISSEEVPAPPRAGARDLQPPFGGRRDVFNPQTLEAPE